MRRKSDCLLSRQAKWVYGHKLGLLPNKGPEQATMHYNISTTRCIGPPLRQCHRLGMRQQNRALFKCVTANSREAKGVSTVRAVCATSVQVVVHEKEALPSTP
jgi:hypothetical protein